MPLSIALLDLLRERFPDAETKSAKGGDSRPATLRPQGGWYCPGCGLLAKPTCDGCGWQISLNEQFHFLELHPHVRLERE